MGLFSSKKRTYVSSTTINLIDNPGNPEKSALVHSLFNNTNITDDLISSYNNGMHLKFNAAYLYGRDHYTLGLPQGTLEQGQGDPTAVKAVLESLLGVSINIAYCVLATGCDDDFAYGWLKANRGWNYETGEVTVHPFITTTSKVYYVDATVTANNTLQITYQYGVTEIKPRITETITLSDLIPKALYYRVRYHRVNGDGSLQANPDYWYYRIDSCTHPSLNNPPYASLISPFYPVVPLRKNNVDLTDSSLSGTELYQTSKRLLKKVGMDIQHLGDSINANPNVGDIDHAFLYFGIDLQTEVPASQKYLLEFFAYLAPLSATSYLDYVRWLRNPTSIPPHSIVKFEDAGYKAEICYQYIRVRYVTGSIGKVGTVTRTNIVRDRKLWGGFNLYYNRYYDNSSIIFRHQVAPNSYKEVEILGLEHTNYVYDKHTVLTNLEESINTDCALTLPINRHVFNSLSVRDRISAAHNGLKIVFNSYQVVKSKWYESSFFQFVTIVIAVVATAFGAWQVGAAIVAASTATEIAMIVLAAVVQAVALTYAFKVVAKALGAQFTLILAAAIALYTLGSGIKSGSLKGVPYAGELLSVSTGLAKGVAASIQEQLEDLTGELAANKKEQATMWDKLESAQQLLETNGIIDPMAFTNVVPLYNPYETPEDYYYRTVHSGNIGVLSLDAPANYVDYMLTLPRASEESWI